MMPAATVAQDFASPRTVSIPAGEFLSGSDQAERKTAYALDEFAYGHAVTRDNKWYEDELPRTMRKTGAFEIMKYLVTNADFAVFVSETRHRAPQVDRETWDGYGLNHPFERTQKYQWHNGMPPDGRENHPVVLVSLSDAEAYADWLSGKSGKTWRLATQIEWEKAMRGTDGRIFPWGNDWDPEKLNSHDTGPFDTFPVGSFPAGASPYGVMDPAGQVFEWIAGSPAEGRHWVKGGSWDDKGCGVCRPASRHGRPDGLKHILIGFRLVREP